MKTSMLVTSTLLALLSIAPFATAEERTEVLSQTTRPLYVRYKSGEVERYIVKWEATKHVNHFEDGHPAIPAQFLFTDTRQCHWDINSRIVRTLLFVNRNGEQFLKPDLTTALNLQFANKGSDLVLTRLRSENCGDANDRYQSDLRDSTKALTDAFPTTVEKDFDLVRQTMAKWPDVTAVSSSEPTKQSDGEHYR